MYFPTSVNMTANQTHNSVQFMKFPTKKNIAQMENQTVKNTPENNHMIVRETAQPKKMIWGEPTWFFLHTLAHKVKEEDFNMLKKEILDIVYSVCVNLPCPDCAVHAKEYLDKTNFNFIQTKFQLKMMLMQFHNMVNKRKGIPVFTLEQLDEKYSKANFANIVNYFIQNYSHSKGNVKMIAEDFHRKKMVENIRIWLNSHVNSFEM